MKSNRYVLCPDAPGEGLGPENCAPPCGSPPHGPGPCPGCPTVIKDKSFYLIDDDYGDSVKIEEKDINLILDELNNLLS